MQTHNFHKADDEDWIKFIGFAGKSYTIKAVNIGSSDMVIELYDAKDMSAPYLVQDTLGNELADEELDFNNCPHDGTWFARIKLYDSNSFSGNNDYELRNSLQEGPKPGTVQGIVRNSVTGKFIGEAVIITDKQRGDFSDPDDGSYRMMVHPSGEFELTSEVDGYEPCLSLDFLEDGGVLDKNLNMIPADLGGVLFILKIMAGYSIPEPFCWKDRENGDGKMGMDDAVYILQKVAGLR